METVKRKAKYNRKLPLLIEKGKNGWYVVECPLFSGCYTQGKTIDEAIANIREVIELILEEKDAQKILRNYNPQEISLHTITM
ncbi:MAG: type II toxin-antitoxin system HicB family antitoxin [Melioribacteraceae bacterium]|jgi:predicted RNase H-like HicB family nuclease